MLLLLAIELYGKQYIIQLYPPEHGKDGAMETNLAGNPEYAEKLAKMEALLLEQMKAHDDSKN